MDYQTLMVQAVDIAQQTAEKIMAVYREKDFDIQIKSDASPVTRADIIAHQFIEQQLQAVSTELPILSEESTSIDWQQRQHWQSYWLIDPLDGTKEFVDRNDEFTVNIALIENNQPVIGVVVAPALKKSYMAAKGLGAYKIIGTEDPVAINSRSVPKVNGEEEFTIVIGRRSVSKSLNRFFTNMPQHQIKHLGSALKTCLIAEGKADIYPRFGSISEWDTAAAQCVLEEAGGAVTDMQMQPLQYNTKDSLLNPEFIAWGDGTIDWSIYIT